MVQLLTLVDYHLKNQKTSQEYRDSFREIQFDVSSILQSIPSQFVNVYEVAGYLDDVQDLLGDVMFAQNTFFYYNGTEMAYKMIISRINDRIKILKVNRKILSEVLGEINNNQIIYLGNDARKIIAKSIKQTDDWVDKSSAFRPKEY